MLQTFLNVLLIIAGFGLLIFVHELGHFVAAKWAGIRTEAFAIGMGPVIISWRKGIGLRPGSTWPAVEKRVREHFKSSGIDIDERGGDEIALRRQVYRAMDALGIGETEYSLRWLPIGGFVKMLGQEDANPNYVSDDPRSYNMRPIGKRMIVVSAGVIMNLIFAVLAFIVAFMIGVRFPAPVVGDVIATMPAARAVALNAAALRISAPGLQPGDRVVAIDGKPSHTFADLRIAAAMAKPGDKVFFTIERAGVPERLTFEIEPQLDSLSGLLGLGVTPGSSATLYPPEGDPDGLVRTMLERSGLAAAGVEPGMTIVAVNDQPITTYGQLALAAEQSNGQPLRTRWAMQEEKSEAASQPIDAMLDVDPDFEQYLQREGAGDQGLLGFAPLVRVARIAEGSPNSGTIKPGDVVIKVAGVPYPRHSQLLATLREHKRETIEVVMLRGGEEVSLQCEVNRKGQLLIEIEAATDVMIAAQPVLLHARYSSVDAGKAEDVETPAARSGLFTAGGTRLLEIAGQPVQSWQEFREATREVTRNAADTGEAAVLEMRIAHPISGRPEERIALSLTADEVQTLHALGWSTQLPGHVFQPIWTIRRGTPLQSIIMGFEETHKIVMMTYLTIDRLVRGSVGVDQLRGPVGIVHIGSQVAREGPMYLLFFLGMISVNLAVINFLPLPIVDGGLFLFLIYEKLKGRPPPIAFQNFATIVGLMIIGTIFVVTFYNDVLRLFS